ncbi:phage integrase SAM-like domain-containing protein [Pontiellaceae bacterium B12227]|nr:phage integrase SAM-like domain-containing protein [Pontiellaceae bacterium B12227]
MKVQLRHVQQRGNTLYFRIHIPVALRNYYDGRKEISQTLRTDDHIEAQGWATQLAKIYQKQFRELRSGRQVDFSQGSEELLGQLEQSAPNIRAVERVEPVPSGPTLSVVYEEVKALGKRCEKEESERWASTKLLIGWCGDLPISQFTRPIMLDFRDNVLRCMPVHMSQKKVFQGKTLKQVMEMKHKKVVSTTTVNNHLSRLRSVFNYAVRHGYILTSPTVDLELTPDKSPDEERTAYTKDQLQRMINGLSEHAVRGGDLRHMRFWVPLIALYSGARLNEICQMCIGDVVEIDGILCFDINERNKEITHKNVKNKSSRRRIPIHPDLIELGFLRFVAKRKRAFRKHRHEFVNLWPAASYQEKKGWRRKISHWFNEVFRTEFLTPKELADHRAGRKSYCFHSLRHVFISQCQSQARMNARIEMRISGHADEFISEVHARYGKDMHPKVLLEELVKLDYGLDVSKLRNRY